MNHDNFETHMIDFVNRNAEEAEVVRNDNLREARETEGYLRRCKTINATIEAILWGAFVTLAQDTRGDSYNATKSTLL